jgi:uracil-DNA glycosylase
MSRQRDSVLREIGLGPIWRLRERPAEVPVSQSIERPAERDTIAAPEAIPSAQPAISLAVDKGRVGAIAAMGWPELKSAVAECQSCVLGLRRRQAVLGVGDLQADWLFVGEGPGAEEDERGEPFVGQAGKLLDAMLEAIDLRRGDNVYIANAVKCRPPGNRTPEAEETAACWPYLERQIALLKPKLIVALGRPAAQTLLRSEVKISSARGRLFEFGGIPLIVTYHPAYLLRNLPDKAKAWEDLCFMRRTMRSL